jgi:hypothetical protein
LTSISERRLLNELTLDEDCFLVMRRIISGERLVSMFDTLYVDGLRLVEMYGGGEADETETGL